MELFIKIKNVLLQKSSRHIGFKIIAIDNILSVNRNKPIYNKKPAFLRIGDEPFQFADPFVFINDESLYCFFEEKKNSLPGQIKVVSSSDFNTWTETACDLGVSCHLSFPFIIRHDEKIFMLPESAALGEVTLYACRSFPAKWEKHKVLLKGNFVDSHIYYLDGYFYLFSTLKVPVTSSGSTFFNYELRLFYAETIDGLYSEHPCSPLQVGRKFGRSGGSISGIQGSLYRWSQDCSNRYGKELYLFRIIEITPRTYKEERIQDNWVSTHLKHKSGGHHISIAYLNNDIVVAIDFNYKDSYTQRFLNFIGARDNP